MLKKLNVSVVLGSLLLLLSAGCAHTQNPQDADKSHRARNALIAVGTVVAVGVLMGKKAQDNVRDAAGPDRNP